MQPRTKFELTILGSNSAIPSYDRFHSAQILNINENLYLIDCGEGAQIKMSQFKVKRSKIHHIFISHLHGDHIFGLPGLLTSYHMQSREDTLHIFGPHGIRDYIEKVLEITEGHLNYPVEFHEFHPQAYHKLFEDGQVTVWSFPLKHRLPTSAYLFAERIPFLNIRKDAIATFELNVEQIKLAKEGKDILLPSGVLIPNEKLTLPKKRLRKYAYCSDTGYDESIVPYVTGVDLLYHEATYTEDMKTKADDRMHSTAMDAARIARKARVGKLVIGHYSSRYKDLSALLEEACQVFPETVLALEGDRIMVEINN